MSRVNGFKFVVTTPSHPGGREEKRLVRSHVSRGRGTRKKPRSLPSWITRAEEIRDDRGDAPDQRPVAAKATIAAAAGAPLSRTPGTGLSCARFPDDVQPYMLQDVATYLSIYGGAMYPQGICESATPSNGEWIWHLLSDPAYLHAMVYSTEAYHDMQLCRPWSMRTQSHFLKTLGLLRTRLAGPDIVLATSDATFRAIGILALVADIHGQASTVKNHLEGLRAMLALRGGFGKLKNSVHETASKICRLDLSNALCNNTRPVLFNESAISWEIYLVDSHLKSPSIPHADNDEVSQFVNSLDTKLSNIWRDLHEFCRISDIAIQTGRKVPQTIFSEIMVSVLYRLTHLSFPAAPLHEAFRHAMIVFSTGILFSWRALRRINAAVGRAFQDALWKLRSSGDHAAPRLTFWILTVWNVLACRESSSRGLFTDWTRECVEDLPLCSCSSWEGARAVLKRILWIGALHDRQGELAFASRKRKEDVSEH